MRKKKIGGYLLLVLGLSWFNLSFAGDACSGDPGGDNTYECIVIKNYIPSPIKMSASRDDCTDNTAGRFNSTVPAATDKGPGIWHQKLGVNSEDGCSVLCAGVLDDKGGAHITLDFKEVGSTRLHVCRYFGDVTSKWHDTIGRVYPNHGGGDTTISLGRPGH